MHVIDASALMAYLHDEPSARRVSDCLDGSLIASINLCEVIQKAKQFGADIDGLHEDLIALDQEAPVLTADRAWGEITLPVAVAVEVIR